MTSLHENTDLTEDVNIITVYVNGPEFYRAWGGWDSLMSDEADRLSDIATDVLNELRVQTADGDVLEFVGINVPDVPAFAILYGSAYVEPWPDIEDALCSTESTQLAILEAWEIEQREARRRPVHLYADSDGKLLLLRDGDDTAISNVDRAPGTFLEDAIRFEEWRAVDEDNFVDASWWGNGSGPTRIATMDRVTGIVTVHCDLGPEAQRYFGDSSTQEARP